MYSVGQGILTVSLTGLTLTKASVKHTSGGVGMVPGVTLRSLAPSPWALFLSLCFPATRQ